MKRRAWLRWSALAIAVVLVGGCSSVSYYWQAATGQVDVLLRRQAIEDLLSASNSGSAAPLGITPELQARLALVLEIREFASTELALDVGGAYSAYADIERDYLVWSVVATDELSLKPHSWCYPVVGCLSYRGFHQEDRARAFADDLEAKGLDVYVAPVRAYSTLGWFDDPVLNTYVYLPEPWLAAILFHELTHRTLYVAGETRFNEAYAVAVEQMGTERWLRRAGEAEMLARFRAAVIDGNVFRDLLGKTRRELEAIYASELPADIKRQRKVGVLAALRERHDEAGRLRGAPLGFDAWFDRPLNNARLALFATYHELVPCFLKLASRTMGDVDGDLERFHERVAEMARASTDSLVSDLERLVPGTC